MNEQMKNTLNQFITPRALNGRIEAAGVLYRVRITSGGRTPSLDAKTTVKDADGLQEFTNRLGQFMEAKDQSFPLIAFLGYEESVDRHGNIRITLGSVATREIVCHVFSKSPNWFDIHKMLQVLANGGME
jgi:hypothetical protein